MTKFLNQSFRGPANNKNYNDNYKKVFGFTSPCKACDAVCKVKVTGEERVLPLKEKDKPGIVQEEVECQTCSSTFWLNV